MFIIIISKPVMSVALQGYDMASGLPPMSSFRGPGASSTTGGGSVATSSPLYTHSPVPNHTQASATGGNASDTLGKALPVSLSLQEFVCLRCYWCALFASQSSCTTAHLHV